MAKSLTSTILVTSTSNAANGTVRGTVDLSLADGGIVTLKITNGGTGPTAQCEARILIAHAQASLPAAGAEGSSATAWKQVATYGGGLVANISTRGSYRFGREVAYLEVEFTGNTGQAVTVEAYCTSHQEV